MNVVVSCCAIAVALWSFAGVTLSWFGKRDHFVVKAQRLIWAELRPFYLPCVVVLIGQHVMTGEMLGWNAFFHACQILNWFLFKDIDDDDRWKRRKAKLVEKIERRGARLVAVPVGGES